MNAISNLPVQASDVDLAEKIYGPDIGTLKGKTTRKSPLPMETDIIELPPEITEDRSSWELCMDVMFVYGMPFLTSITRKLFYRTAQFIPSRQAKHLYAALDDVFRIYNHNGFTIDKIYADREFKSIMNQVKDELQVIMQYSPSAAHVPEIERCHRVFKERIRSAFHRLPFKALPIPVMKMLVMETARRLCWLFYSTPRDPLKLEV